MSSPFESLALRLTRRIANHPILWIVFGCWLSTGLVFAIKTGEPFVPVARLIRAFDGMSSPRFFPVSLERDPVLYGIMIVVLAGAPAFSFAVGAVAWRARRKRDF